MQTWQPGNPHAPFPPDGKLLVVGMDVDDALRARFFKRVHFRHASSIMNKDAIPNVQGVLVSKRMDEGEKRRVNDCSKAAGVHNIIPIDSMVVLRQQLDGILKGIDLNTDPEQAAPPAPPAPPNGGSNNGSGGSKLSLSDFVRQNANLAAHQPMVEAKRLLAIIKQLGIKNAQGQDPTDGAIYQQILTLRKRAGTTPAAAPQGPTVESAKKLASRVEAMIAATRTERAQFAEVVAGINTGFDRRLTVLNGLLADARALEAENVRLLEERAANLPAVEAYRVIEQAMTRRTTMSQSRP